MRERAKKIVVWAPSPWMMLALSVWWAWRWAALPSTYAQAGAAVMVGFAHDAMVLYGMFALLRWLHRAEPAGRSAVWWQRLTATLLAASASLRALDALQVHLTDHRATPELMRVLASDPLVELWGLRGMVLAVLLSAGVAAWTLRSDTKMWRRLIALGVDPTARLDIAGGGVLLAGLLLALLRAGDSVSGAPEWAVLHAISGAFSGD